VVTNIKVNVVRMWSAHQQPITVVLRTPPPV
jgi:hypothetical protein